MHRGLATVAWLALLAGACATPDDAWVQARPRTDAVLGSACSGDDGCASGFCVGGLCCDAACDGPCEVCDGLAGVGRCLPAPSVDAVCAEGAVCDASGQCAAAIRWGRTIGDQGSQTVTAATALGEGLLVAGRFDGALVALGEPISGNGAFLAAFDAEGELQWRSVIEGPFYPTSLAARGARIVVGGEATGELLVADELLLADGSDGVVLRFDAEGTADGGWLLAGPAHQRVQAVAVTAEDEVVAVGRHTGALPSTEPPLGPDAFVARLDDDGVRWVRSFGSLGADEARSVVVMPDGAVAVGGVINGPTIIGRVALDHAEGDDAFVAAFEPDGALRWAHAHGGIGADGVGAMALDPVGDVVVVGSFTKVIDFAPAAAGAVAESMQSLGCEDVFVTKINAQGESLWSRRYGDAEPQLAEGVAVAADGGIHVAGMIYGGIELGWGLAAAGGQGDVHVAAFEGDGSPRWVRVLGDAARQRPHGIAVVGQEVLALVGYVEGELIDGAVPLVSGGAGDGFVMALGL